MRQFISLATAALLLGIFLPDGHAVAQSAPDTFRGSTWRLVSGRVERGGKKLHLTAPRLQGFLMFDSNDHFLIVIMRSDLPKIASNSGQAGIRGNLSTLQSSIASFGTYSINDPDHTINAHIEGSTFPKWIGTDQKRWFVVNGDNLKLANSPPLGGRGTAESVWKRVK
jgi:Lipocalin-like domain